MTDIRTRRFELGLKQESLAKKAGVSLTTLKKWERGLEEPDNDGISAVARVLACDVKELVKAQKTTATEAVPGEGYTTASNQAEFEIRRRRDLQPSTSKVLDLFCGAGGFSFGFDQHDYFQVSCGIDLLADRVNTFSLNHPSADAIAADLRDFPISALADRAANPDIIIGGPPCQGFSSIRPFRNLTEGDKRNSLPEQYLLTVAALMPRWIVFENVVGLLSHRKGSVLNDVIDGLRDLGYRVEWKVINAAMFGLPQNRERLFIVGNLFNKEFEWPAPTHRVSYRSMAGKNAPLLATSPLLLVDLLPEVTVSDAIGDLPPIEAGGQSRTYSMNFHVTEYQRSMRQGCDELLLHSATRHSEKMMKIIRLAGKNRLALPDGMTTSGFSSCYSRLDGNGPSTTITVNFVHPSSNRCIHPTQHRALTPREGARLQGFPDAFQFFGTRAQVVKQIGNAVPPLMGRVIANSIAEQDLD